MIFQDFQHFVEFQLSEVTNVKTHMIQFESIVNLIQMRLLGSFGIF
jgi:hypothetical protein